MKFKLLWFLLGCAVFAALPSEAFAQDQIHYLPPVYSRSATSTNSLPADFQLVLTTNEAAPFDVFCETGDGVALAGSPFSVAADGPAVLTLGSFPNSTYPGFVSGAGALNTVLADAGIVCRSSAAFFTNIRTLSEDGAQAASLTGKGRIGLGTDFRTGHFKAQGNNDSNDLKSHFAAVMATEDNTTVNVTEIKSGVIFTGTASSGVPLTSEPISVVLDAGESYVVAHHFSNTVAGTDDVNGTRITADKPIAVNTGSWLGGAKAGNGGRDIAIDQTVPSIRLRDEYVVFDGAETTDEPGEDVNLERPLVVATEDDTNVFVNGGALPVNITPLAAGDYIFLNLSDFDANGLMHVVLRDSGTGNPVAGYLYQSTNAALNGNGPTMGVLPSVPCLSTSRVEIEDATFFGNSVMQIVARTGANIVVNDSNGLVTLPAPINPTGSTDYETYRITGLAAGGVTVDSDLQFFVTMASEQNNRGVQATYTGFADAPLIIDPVALSTDTVAYPVLLTLEQSVGIQANGFQWFQDGAPIAGATGDSLLATEPGIYAVTGTSVDCGVTPQSVEVLLPGELELNKEVVATTQSGPTLYDVTYRFSAENFTGGTLSDIQITDDLEAALAPLVPGLHWSIIAGPTVGGDFTGGEENATFDGQAGGDTNLLGAGVDLDTRERGVIELTVRVDIVGGVPVGSNQATITEGTTTFTADSTAEFPQPNPLNVIVSLGTATDLGGDLWDLPYTISVTNETAGTLATNLQLQADFEAALGPLATADWSIQIAPAASGALGAADINAAFDGLSGGTINLLEDGVELSPGETATVTITIRIDVSGNVPSGALSVLGLADSFITDSSDDAFGLGHLSVDGPDGDTDPTNDPTPADIDTDGDGDPDFTDTDDDNDGIDDDTDPARLDPDLCGDSDTDLCDDCSVGLDDFGAGVDSIPNDDGTDTDGDGQCDVGDTDDDDDGVDDGDDLFPVDGNQCRDVDVDGCDDCSSGADNALADGADGDVDGICNLGQDTDSDGIIDVLDLDDDGDGIPDLAESPSGLQPDGDADGDGVFNYLDSNDRGDGTGQACAEIVAGVCDGSGAAFDQDADGVPNHLDLDADGDGLLDVVEAGHDAADADSDGLVDCASGVGANGLCDDLESSADSGLVDYDGDGNGPDSERDTDGVGPADFLDLDADDDGISDRLEGGSGCTDTTPADGRCDGADTDGDGIVDDLDGLDGFGDDAYEAPTDTDGNAVPDYRSLDADGDTLQDLLEGVSGCIDATPADGRCDGPDADGDGLADDADATTPDSDGDLRADFQDVDADNDGLRDSLEGSDDTDGDGLANFLDLDSDDDGITDSIEGNTACADTTPADARCDGPDADGDGLADDASGLTPPDTDGDGAIDVLDLDSDNDGASDLVEGASGCADTTPADSVCDGPDADGDGLVDDAAVQTPPDSDGDGAADFRDLDSDNDGIVDLVEVASGCADADENSVCDQPDTDGDGIVDSIDDAATFGDPNPTVPADMDGAGEADFLDLDSDGDGTADVDDASCEDLSPVDQRCDGADSDGDGAVDDIDGLDGFGTSVDTDGDGVGDTVDLDDDNDGIPDDLDGPGDTDGDGVPDSLDLDADNDGIPDALEAGHGELTSDGGLVCSGGFGVNGLCDAVENGADSGDLDYELADTDTDGVPDFQDLDSDNDGIPDLIEGDSNCTDDDPDDAVCDGGDADGDGVPDSADNSVGFGTGNDHEVPDTDGDGTPDYQDLDSDGDGISDVDEGGNGEFDADNDGVVDGDDTDGDGVLDPVDLNPDFGVDDPGPPLDTDGDGIPDFRDLDSDGDTVSDDEEGGEPGQDPPDTDGDGIPDYRDTDSDDDGVTDGVDNCYSVPNGAQEDEDADGDGQACDSDDNGDGIDDTIGISGGGCSTTGGRGPLGGALLLLMALAWLSLRGQRRRVGVPVRD